MVKKLDNAPTHWPGPSLLYGRPCNKNNIMVDPGRSGNNNIITIEIFTNAAVWPVVTIYRNNGDF